MRFAARTFRDCDRSRGALVERMIMYDTAFERFGQTSVRSDAELNGAGKGIEVVGRLYRKSLRKSAGIRRCGDRISGAQANEARR